jgi:hypothetical protein
MEALPLIRLSYESALTAHWIAQNIDGAEAVLNRDVQSRQAAVQTLKKANSEVLRSGVQNFPYADRDLLRTSSQAQARNFEQLCHDLEPGGADAYAYYRLMSWYSHPSARIIDSYVQPPSNDTDITTLRLSPVDSDANMWTHFIAYSLIWSARAVDFVDANRTHRSELREAARKFGISDVLKLSDDAIRRTKKAEQDQRRSNWKRPDLQGSSESP